MKNKKTQTNKASVTMVIEKLNIIALLLIIVVYGGLLSLVVAVLATEQEYVFIPKYDHQLDQEVNVQLVIANKVTGTSTITTSPYIYTIVDTKTTTTEEDTTSETFTSIKYSLGLSYNDGTKDDIIYSKFYSTVSELPATVQRMGIVQQGSTSSSYTGNVTEIKNGALKSLLGDMEYWKDSVKYNINFQEDLLEIVEFDKYLDTLESDYLNFQFSLLENSSSTITYKIDLTVKDLTKNYHIDLQSYIGKEDSVYPLFGLYNYADDDSSFSTADISSRFTSTDNSFVQNENFQFIYTNIVYYDVDANIKVEYYYKTDLQKLIAIL